MSIEAVLGSRIVVCAGSGGVGPHPQAPRERWARIPYLPGEVADLHSLVGVGAYMFV